MRDEDIIVFHHNLPPFLAQRMNWLEHQVLRDRQALTPPVLSRLPPLTPVELRSNSTPTTDEELMNPDELG
jgi:hypothetical protein